MARNAAVVGLPWSRTTALPVASVLVLRAQVLASRCARGCTFLRTIRADTFAIVQHDGDSDRYDPCLQDSTRPIRRCDIVVGGLGRPIPVRPGIIAERRSVLELLLRDTGDIAAQFCVVFEGSPRDRIMAVPKADKTPEAHYGIGHTPRNLVDHQVVNIADFAAFHVIYV